MKIAASLVALSTLMVLLWTLLITDACDAKSAQDVEVLALSVEQTACVFVQAELGASEPALIATACAIPPGMIQQIISALTAHRTMRAKFTHDGGAK